MLHATRDIRGSIKRIMSLLAPGGILVLYEVTRPPAWFDISIALIEGWQLFDDGLRLDSPLLSREQWHEVLRTPPGSPKSRRIRKRIRRRKFWARTFFWPACPRCKVLNRLLAKMLGVENHAARTAVVPAKKVLTARRLSRALRTCFRKLGEAVRGERHEMLVKYVRGHVAKVLGREDSDLIERRQRLMDLGDRFLDGGPAQKPVGNWVGL